MFKRGLLAVLFALMWVGSAIAAGPIWVDRVQDTSATTGTTDFVLSGTPPTGLQAWSTVGNTNTAYYLATDTAGDWEIGLGTYSSTGPTLARTTVIVSSNVNAKVVFPAGTKTVSLTQPAQWVGASLQSTNNLSELSSASTARTNLGLGTAATQATGTSGGTLPFLNGTNTFSAVQSFNDSDLALKGVTSGSTTVTAAATASGKITLPAGTTDFSGTGGTSQVVKQVTVGAAFTVARLACSDMSDGATGCSTATGTSGATIPLLNGTNTWSGVQSFNAGDLVVKGSSSGTLDIRCAATCGARTITFPAGTTDFSGTGGASQFVKQASAGAALTVARPACADLSDSNTGCSSPSGGSTLLGTMNTTGATTMTLTGLTLTSYHMLEIAYSGISTGNAGGASFTQNSHAFAVTTVGAGTSIGGMTIDLATGAAWGIGGIQASSATLTANGWDSGLTTASTAITFTASAGNFDGTPLVKVYGIP